MTTTTDTTPRRARRGTRLGWLALLPLTGVLLATAAAAPASAAQLGHPAARAPMTLAQAPAGLRAAVRAALLAVAAAVGLLAGPAAAATGPAAGAGPAAASVWQVVPSANPQASQTTNSTLASVSAASATDGWAVGQFMDAAAASHPLAEHWNGSAWSVVPVPQPAGAQASLAGVDQLSSSNAWAVGTSTAGTASQPLIEHFTGTGWSIVPGASLPAGATGDLNAIGGTGPGDLWTAGFTTSASGQEGVLFEHFNGTTWQQVPFPTQLAACDPGGVSCFLDPQAVSAASASDVWVVGTILEPNPTGNFTAHFNGTAWSVVHPPCLQGNTVVARCDGGSADLNGLTGVTALSPTDAWASGSEGNVSNTNFNIPYVLHWNGTTWSLIKTPNLGGEGSLLNGITALNANDVWAAGQTQQLNGAITPLTEHFTGTTWTLVPAPAPGTTGRLPSDSLASITSPGGHLLFAIGARDIPGQCCLRTLALKTTSG